MSEITFKEIKRLESFVYPDQVSILGIGDPQNTMVIDVGAGPNTNLGKYVQSKGGKYVALDINRFFLENTKKERIQSLSF